MIADRQARNRLQRERMQRRRANRAVIDGYLTSLDERCQHGDYSGGYVAYACRCQRCGDARSNYWAAYKAGLRPGGRALIAA
ncbi:MULTISPECIES: hypothetical protein [unclassified Nocardia]|uniref:hypothetical protein n=1 Tax=unclassified Nocardia TaxID=2637762 RepID=UPI00278C5B0B|nr:MULTISPECIES: hypothetical protein [unclassified Nocardia]